MTASARPGTPSPRAPRASARSSPGALHLEAIRTPLCSRKDGPRAIKSLAQSPIARRLTLREVHAGGFCRQTLLPPAPGGRGLAWRSHLSPARQGGSAGRAGALRLGMRGRGPDRGPSESRVCSRPQGGAQAFPSRQHEPLGSPRDGARDGSEEGCSTSARAPGLRVPAAALRLAPSRDGPHAACQVLSAGGRSLQLAHLPAPTLPPGSAERRLAWGVLFRLVHQHRPGTDLQ